MPFGIFRALLPERQATNAKFEVIVFGRDLPVKSVRAKMKVNRLSNFVLISAEFSSPKILIILAPFYISNLDHITPSSSLIDLSTDSCSVVSFVCKSLE